MYFFNLYNSIMLAGIIQGLIFGVVVMASKKYRFPATLLLGAFILSFSLDNLQYYLEDTGIISTLELYSRFFIPFQLLSGPLFLFYGLYLVNPDRKFRRENYLVFLPFAISFTLYGIYKIAFLIDPSDLFLSEYLYYVESYTEFFSLLFDVSILIYLYRKVVRADERNKAHHIGTPLAWFRSVLISLFVLTGLWFLVVVADYLFDTEYWYVIYIGMSVIIYWMGHVGIYKFGVQQARKNIRMQARKEPVAVEKHKNEHIAALETLLIEKRRFLDPTLTLDKVADELNLSKSHLSRIINSELQTGFPDYLNALRVEEAKAYLNNPEFSNYTLVAIGLEAGFNSKTTFNTAFKKLTTVTPSEFRNRLN